MKILSGSLMLLLCFLWSSTAVHASFFVAKPDEWAKEQKRGEKFLKLLGGDETLTVFLREQIEALMECDGIKLDASLLTEKWKILRFDQHFRLSNAKWYVKSSEKSEIIEFWQCEGRKDSKAVCIVCRVHRKKLTFEKVEVRREPMYVM